MRFNKIRIAAYGPFTGLELELPKAGGDFHLFHGPNEAGKSSLLRSLRAFLFGIPGQTKDTFLHSGPQMKIAAELEKQDGSSRTFQRRKGNKNTLLDENDAALAESELQQFLGGVDEAYFDSMFGLGSEELRRGADALLRGEGRLGEALFSASLGGTPVDKVIQSLELEATRLFRGRAGSSIRDSRSQFDGCLKLAKEAIIKPEAWELVQSTIHAQRHESARLLAEKQNLVNRRNWLERCRDALPVVGQWRECLRQLAEIPALPELADSFGLEIQEARRSWRGARERIEPLTIQLESLQTQAASGNLAPGVLAEEAEIERLHSGIGVYREQQQQLATRRTEAAQTKLKIEAACKNLEITTPVAELENKRISLVRFLAIERTAAALAAAGQDLTAATEKIHSLDKEIEALTQQRSPATADDISALEQAHARTKSLEEIAKGLAASEASLAELWRKMEDLKPLLRVTPVDHQQIVALKVPLKATIERYRDALDELKRDEAQLKKRRSEEQSKADKLSAEIESFTRQHELPSLAELAAARAHRERGWSLVLEDWKGAGASQQLTAGIPLETAYPLAVAAADEVADRLRTDAEAVARIEQQQTQLNLSERALAGLLADATQLAAHKSELETQWANSWNASGVSPLSPREMLEWRDHWEALGRLWTQWRADTEKFTHDQSAVASAARDLETILARPNQSLTDLLTEARERIAKHHQSVGADRALLGHLSNKTSERQSLAGKLPELTAQLDAARSAWDACRAEFSLPGALPAEAAVGLLRSRKELFVDYDKWCELTLEGEALVSKISTFEAGVCRLITALRLESGDPQGNVARLWQSLESAKTSQRRHDELQQRISKTASELAQVRQQVTQARDCFDGMLRAATLAADEDLDGFLNHYEERKKVNDRMRTLRDSLAGFARNEAVEDFIGRIALEDADALDGSLAGLDGQIAGLDPVIETTRNALLESTNQLKAMEAASDESARQSQLAELAAARIQQDGERFVRLQLAISLLKSRIDRFREQNQGPFMEQASRWFAEITGAAFTGIATTYDAGDQPVIAGQRSADGPNRTVPVAGMSEGTRDQLFLALRLAGLELHLAEHEPMPLILDDLLVHFDDERALRALTALRAFGQRSQVLLFTHHSHLVQLVERHWGSGGYHLHQLTRTAP